MSGKVIPLKKPEPVPPAPPPWIPGDIFTRDGIDYELVTAGEIRFVELERGARNVEKAPGSLLDLLSNAGALVVDYVLVLRPMRPA